MSSPMLLTIFPLMNQAAALKATYVGLSFTFVAYIVWRSVGPALTELGKGAMRRAPLAGAIAGVAAPIMMLTIDGVTREVVLRRGDGNSANEFMARVASSIWNHLGLTTLYATFTLPVAVIAAILVTLIARQVLRRNARSCVAT